MSRALNDQMERNFVDIAQSFDVLDGTEFDHRKERSRIFSGLELSWGNFAFYFNAEGLRYLHGDLKYFRSKDLPFTLSFSPNCDGRDTVLDELQKQGGKEFEITPVMLASIKDLDLELRTHLEYRRISSAKECEIWFAIHQESFGQPVPGFNAFKKWMRAYGYDEAKTFQNYIGFDGETPVAIGSYFLNHEFAAFYNIAVPEAHRRKGFASDITRHVLREAKVRGAKAAGCYAGQSIAEVYRKLGFNDYDVLKQISFV